MMPPATPPFRCRCLRIRCHYATFSRHFVALSRRHGFADGCAFFCHAPCFDFALPRRFHFHYAFLHCFHIIIFFAAWLSPFSCWHFHFLSFSLLLFFRHYFHSFTLTLPPPPLHYIFASPRCRQLCCRHFRFISLRRHFRFDAYASAHYAFSPRCLYA